MPASPILAIGSCFTAGMIASNGLWGSRLVRSIPYYVLGQPGIRHRIADRDLGYEIAQGRDEIDHLGEERVGQGVCSVSGIGSPESAGRPRTLTAMRLLLPFDWARGTSQPA